MQVTLHSSESYYSHQSYQLSSQQKPSAAQEKAAAPTDQVLNKLADNIPGMSGSELKALKADDFTPEKVSDRIADYVAMGLERARREGKSDAEIQNIYEQSVAGIEKGFQEAKDILEEMNLLTASLEETIDTTLNQTLDKVSDLAPTVSSSSPTTTSISAAERYETSESFSLKVRTQDGDKVTIRFSASESYEASLGYFNDGEGTSATAFNINRSEDSNFRFSVRGELDQGEIDALQNLIQDVSLIADDFFDGDVQAAFEQASEFQMDKTELAAMRLTLKQTEEYSSVAAYQQVQGYEQTNQNVAGDKKLGHMINGIQEQVAQSKVQFVESVTKFSMKLFDSLVHADLRYRESSSESQSRYESNLSTLHDLIETADLDD